ncbi:MAG TPA: hypothetical protein DCL66_04830 [Gammaproteobacteria bacterium]|nr:hypothetical protein [Gammaproteobacteria bacterium]
MDEKRAKKKAAKARVKFSPRQLGVNNDISAKSSPLRQIKYRFGICCYAAWRFNAESTSQWFIDANR